MRGKSSYSLCGSPDYIAPEMILGVGHSRAVDYWALGIFIFEMVTGRTPFRDIDPLVDFPLILSIVCIDIFNLVRTRCLYFSSASKKW